MNIPQFDQDLATIKATHMQFDDGYHLSEADYDAYISALQNLTDASNKILRQIVKQGVTQ